MSRRMIRRIVGDCRFTPPESEPCDSNTCWVPGKFRLWECFDGPWFYEFSDCGCCRYTRGPFPTRHRAEVDKVQKRNTYRKKTQPNLEFGELYRAPDKLEKSAA